MTDTPRITKSSGNVFADIGLPNPEEHLLKAQIAVAIGKIIRARGLTQAAAAEVAGLTQANVSNILRGQFREISVERLLRVLNALDQDVRITITPKAASIARTYVERQEVAD